MNLSRILQHLLSAVEHAIGASRRTLDMLAAAIARLSAMVAHA